MSNRTNQRSPPTADFTESFKSQAIAVLVSASVTGGLSLTGVIHLYTVALDTRIKAEAATIEVQAIREELQSLKSKALDSRLSRLEGRAGLLGPPSAEPMTRPPGTIP